MGPVVFCFCGLVYCDVLPLQNEDDFAVGLIDLVQRHHVGVGLGQLQHGDLVQNVHAAVLALPSFSQTFGSILLSRRLLDALLYHGKLSPGRHTKKRGGGELRRQKKKHKNQNHTTGFFEKKNLVRDGSVRNPSSQMDRWIIFKP